jgi:Ca2+/Na+ antiporter
VTSPEQEIIWRFHNSHVATAQHHESQRGAVTTMLLAISTALVGLITFDGRMDRSDVPAAIFLVALGCFGALFALKHHERYRAHIERAKEYRDALDGTLEGAPIIAIKARADLRHARNFSLLRRLKGAYWWVMLNLVVALLGLFLLATALR